MIRGQRAFQFRLRTAFLVATVYAVLWGLATWAGPGPTAILALLSAVAVVALVYLGTFYGISRLAQPRRWRYAAIIALCVGVPVGLWVGGGLRYPVSPVREFIGFPIPVVVLQLEDGRWVDFVGNPLVVLLNAFSVAAVFLVPVLFGLMIRPLLANSIDVQTRPTRA